MKISINKVRLRKSLIHCYTVIGFITISLIFYYPLLDGKKLFQSDINQYEGMSREIKENRDCLLYTSPSPRDSVVSRMPSSA